MPRTIATESTEHATRVARALFEAADGDTTKIRTVTGPNGLNAFEVDDDFPDFDVPEAQPQPSRRERRQAQRGAQDEQPDEQPQDEQPQDEQPDEPETVAAEPAAPGDNGGNGNGGEKRSHHKK